jgi:hypothetical protein
MNMNNPKSSLLRKEDPIMPSPRVSALTKKDITAAAKRLRASRPAKWTVIVDGRELPARPLVLEAAGVPPNDPTNSHQAVKILEEWGFDVRYQGKGTNGKGSRDSRTAMEDLIRSLRGSCKGDDSIAEARDREHRLEK